MKINIPKFETDKELFKFIVDNEADIIAQKKSAMKEADGFGFLTIPMKESFSNKAMTEEDMMAKPVIDVKAIINTTNILDSHNDVHIPGLWTKSLQESKRMLHVQEHKSNEYSKIISSGADLKASVETFKWRDLGYDADGETQALVFESKVRKDRNPYMHEQYAKKWVDNHSVGMVYVKLVTCINDEDYPVQKENYDKYYPMIVNKEHADTQKYWWAVLEAKAIEGSAVPNGSNPITPTLTSKENEVGIADKNIDAIKEWLNKPI